MSGTMEQMTRARRALARMQDIPSGWRDTNRYRRIVIPREVERTLRRLGSIEGESQVTFTRLKRNEGVLEP